CVSGFSRSNPRALWIGRSAGATAMSDRLRKAGAMLGAVLLELVLIGVSLADGTPPTSGVAFDGTGAHAVVADAASFDLDAFSIATWVNLRQTSGSQVFVNRGTAGELFT